VAWVWRGRDGEGEEEEREESGERGEEGFFSAFVGGRACERGGACVRACVDVCRVPLDPGARTQGEDV